MGAHYEILGNTGALFSIADPVTEEIFRGVIRRPQAAAVLCVAELGPATVIITRRRPRAEEYGISPRAWLRSPPARACKRARCCCRAAGLCGGCVGWSVECCATWFFWSCAEPLETPSSNLNSHKTVQNYLGIMPSFSFFNSAGVVTHQK